MPPTKAHLRKLVQENMPGIVKGVNDALSGKTTKTLEPVLKRIGRSGELPHWYQDLLTKKSLPNLDGKTIGSVIEMLLVAVLEKETFKGAGAGELRINPARGIDLPDLDLSIKSPSKNYCTSEAFISAYERILGSEYDTIVLLTDYQDSKKKPPLKLRILRGTYLTKTQMADATLCGLARKHRKYLVEKDEVWAQKVFRFLAFVNQGDWRAKRLLKLLDLLREGKAVTDYIESCRKKFRKENSKRLKENKIPIPETEMQALEKVAAIQPIELGVIEALDTWVAETQKDFGRLPNSNEWERFKASPLEGLISISPALQWRYNFGRVFGNTSVDAVEDCS